MKSAAVQEPYASNSRPRLWIILLADDVKTPFPDCGIYMPHQLEYKQREDETERRNEQTRNVKSFNGILSVTIHTVTYYVTDMANTYEMLNSKQDRQSTTGGPSTKNHSRALFLTIAVKTLAGTSGGSC
ncbi:hypothetical protein CBL_06473 [Carabus blaptoides fortunei]